MSHINYLPNSKNAWKKRMIETLKRLPRATYKQVLTVKDKNTGKRIEKTVEKKVSDQDIRDFVNLNILDFSKNHSFTSESSRDDDFKKFEKIKSQKPKNDE